MLQLENKIGENFCYAPWTNIHINTTGQYKTCCAGTTIIGDLKTIPITNLINGKELTEIKKSILNNEYHENCRGCVNMEKNVSRSERHWYEDISNNEIIRIKDLNNQHLQNLDIRWSNTCNLSCVYCDSWASSQWASIKKESVERLDYQNTLEDILLFIDSNKKSLKQIALLGGEPLLQKENDSLLDVIADNVTVYVITNLSVPLENNRIFKKLISKTNVVWDISFDTIGDRFEYVRHGASWNLLLKNLKLLKDITKDKPNHGIGIASVYSVYNALRLTEMFESFKEHDIPAMRWNELHFPDALKVTSLPQQFIMKAITEIEKNVKFIQNGSTFLQEMAKSMQSLTNYDNKDSQYLYDWHSDLEETYWPNFKHKFENLWPEYREI